MLFNVFIKNYKNPSGTLVTSEQLMFTIPTASELPVISPSVKASEDNADSFDFTMEANSPYYNGLLSYKTLIRVTYENNVIFNGRVLTVSGATVYQTKKVHCEGAYGYMNDSWYKGVKEKSKKKITWSSYFDKIIDRHNSLVETYKDLTRGTVTTNGSSTFTPTTEERKYEPSNWTQTISLVNNLKGEFGGHFRVRTTGGLTAGASCTNYLDWYKYFSRDLGSGNRPKVRVGVNIEDLNYEQSTDNMFTRVFVMGKTNNSGEPLYVKGYTYKDKNNVSHTWNKQYIPVTLMRDLYTDEQLNDAFHSAEDYSDAENNYGVIYKVQNFEGAKTKAELWNFAKKWIKECYFGLGTTFTVKAVDMHILDNTKPVILIGDRVDVQYYTRSNGSSSLQTKSLVCKAITYDLVNPENNSYTFGIPSEILNRTFSQGKSGGGGDQAAGGGGGLGGGGDDDEVTFDGVRLLIMEDTSEYGGIENARSFQSGGEMNSVINAYDPSEIDGSYLDHKDQWFKARIIGRITRINYFVFVSSHGTGLILALGGRGYTANTAVPVRYWYSRKSSEKYVPTPPATSGPDLSDTTGPAWVLKVRQHVEEGANKIRQWVIDQNASIFKSTVIDPNTDIEKDNIGFGEADDGGGEIFVNDDDGKETVDVNGNDGTVTLGTDLKNPTNPKPTVLMNGKDKFIKMEKGSDGKWKLQLNVPITYTDAQGQEHTTNNSITAADFQVPTIPSFKTKLAVLDQLVAGEATIGELTAAMARIRALETDAITTNYLSSHEITVNSLVSTQYVSASYVSAGDYKISGESGRSLLGSVVAVRVEPVEGNPGQYKLEYKSWASGDTWFSGGTFNKAGGIESASWSWANGSARVDLSLQGGGTERYTSPAIDHMNILGGLNWIGENKKSFTADFAIYDDNSHLVTELNDYGPIDVSEAWNVGYSKGSPVSGVASGRPGSSYTWTFAITKGDGTTKNIDIDAGAIYTDARQGYTMGNFNLATVTLQGSPVTVTPILGNSGIRLSASSQALRKPGSTVKYDRGTGVSLQTINKSKKVRILEAASTLYRKGDSKTAIGSTRVKLKKYTTASTLYYLVGTNYVPAGTHTWYYTDETNGTEYYTKGSAFNAIGASVTAREVASSSEGGKLYYQANSSKTYYPGDGGAFTVQGESVTGYLTDSSGVLYYKANTPQNLYYAGNTVSDTYYTKS